MYVRHMPYFIAFRWNNALLCLLEVGCNAFLFEVILLDRACMGTKYQPTIIIISFTLYTGFLTEELQVFLVMENSQYIALLSIGA